MYVSAKLLKKTHISQAFLPFFMVTLFLCIAFLQPIAPYPRFANSMRDMWNHLIVTCNM